MKLYDSAFRTAILFLMAGLLFFIFDKAGAQTITPGEELSQVENPSAKNILMVTEAHGKENKSYIGIGDTLRVKVNNIQALLDKVKNDETKIWLYFNGKPLKGISPVSVDKAKGILFFSLKITSDSRDAWYELLSKHKKGVVPLSVTVGYDTGEREQTMIKRDNRLNLIVISSEKLWAFILGFAGLLAVFWVLAKKSTMLRDSGPKPTKGDFTYSLALTQMAFWFFIILASYIYISLITRDMSSPLSQSTLGLMGISSATALGARLVDDSKQRRALASEGWLKDILSDVDGVSLHRFQIVVWTAVLGFFYVQKVYSQLVLPELDNSMLALMGISSGTYIGFKFPEKFGNEITSGPAQQ